MKKITTATLLSVLLMVMNGASMAAQGFTVNIGGNYESTVEVGNVTGVAIGNNARADINVGGIQLEQTSVDIGGDYTVDVTAKNVTAVAIGKNVSARINLGGIQSLQ